jgi:regulator of sigma E protease
VRSLAAGPVANLVLAVLLYALVNWMGAGAHGLLSSRAGSVAQSAAAWRRAGTRAALGDGRRCPCAPSRTALVVGARRAGTKRRTVVEPTPRRRAAVHLPRCDIDTRNADAA